MAAGQLRERAPAASDGGRSERARVVTKGATVQSVRLRIFIGGGWERDRERETEKERGREDLARDWKGDREPEAEVRERVDHR